MTELARSPIRSEVQPMRIMHLSRAAETLGSFMIPTMQEQVRLGHEVCICTDESAHTERLRQAGFEVFIHGMKRSLNPVGALLAIFRIRRFLIERRIEVLICHNPLGGQVGRPGALLAGTPHVIYFAHGLPCGPAQGPLLWRLLYYAERAFAACTTAIVVMNDYDENLSRVGRLSRDPGRVFRIPGMGVDLSKFSTEPAPQLREKLACELAIEPDQMLVLCVARLIPEKGVVELIETARRICPTRKDVVFLLAGTGPLMEQLRSMVRTYGLERQFKVLGWRNDVRDLMKCADVVLLPSYYMEGLPVSILEAMACGKPVVTTKHKGCEDAVVDGQTGYLVPVKAVGPLVEKLVALLDDPTLRARMGRAGRRRAEQYYEIDYCTQTIVGVLDHAMSR